ncbi:MAG: glycine cleavage system protein H [Fibrobacterota bacterium]
MSTGYTKTHEKAVVKKDEIRVFLSAHGLESLGEIQLVDLPETGKRVAAGEAVCMVESQKAATDVHAPCTGRIAAVNEELEDAPDSLHSTDPQKSWIFSLDSFDEAEAVRTLMSEEDYNSFIG